jgi:hypothetical protein
MDKINSPYDLNYVAKKTKETTKPKIMDDEKKMTIEDYNNVIRIFTFKSYFPSAKEVEDELKKLGYKIVKI